MKIPITAKVAKATADYHQHQFVNTWAMKRVLRYIKKKAKQGYYSCCIEIYKDEIECIEAIESANKVDTQSIHKNIKAIKSSLKDTIERLENRIYTPRVAFDLFDKVDGCNIKY